MIAQTLETVSEDRGSGKFSSAEINAMIARHNIQRTSLFTAEELAIKCLEAGQRQYAQLYINPRTASRRHHRTHRYGDCHWGGK